MGKKLIALLICIVINADISGQEIGIHNADLIENDIASVQDSDAGRFEAGIKKADINSDELSELFNAGIISEEELNNIFEHIIKFGPLLSLLELQSVKGFELTRIRQLLPYMYINPAKNVTLKGTRQTISLSGSVRSLSTEDTLQSAMILRYRGSKGNLFTWGITAENDAGEKIRLGPKIYGADYQSGYIELKKYKGIKRIILGDYKAGAGQGLVFWNSYSRGVSADLISFKKTGEGIRPNTGRNESGYFRGLAAELRSKRNTEILIFLSAKRIDAAFHEADNDKDPVIRSFPVSGYHRTTGEMSSRQAVTEKVAGLSAGYRKDRQCIKLNLLHNSFSNVLSQSVHLSVNKRKSYNLGSISYNASILNMDIFGETGVSDRLEISTVNGLLMSASRNLNIGFMFLRTDPGYYSRYFMASSVFGKSSNEESMVLSSDYKLTSRITLNMLLRRGITIIPPDDLNELQDRTDLRLLISYQPTKKTVIKYGAGSRALLEKTGSERLDISERTAILNTSFSLAHALSDKLDVNVSLQSRHDESSGKGSVFTSTITYKHNSILKVSSAATWFDVPSGSFMYSKENVIAGGSSFSALSGKGERYNIVAGIRMPYGLKTEMKFMMIKKVSNKAECSLSLHLVKTIVD